MGVSQEERELFRYERRVMFLEGLYSLEAFFFSVTIWYICNHKLFCLSSCWTVQSLTCSILDSAWHFQALKSKMVIVNISLSYEVGKKLSMH